MEERGKGKRIGNETAMGSDYYPSSQLENTGGIFLMKII